MCKEYVVSLVCTLRIQLPHLQLLAVGSMYGEACVLGGREGAAILSTTVPARSPSTALARSLSTALGAHSSLEPAGDGNSCAEPLSVPPVSCGVSLWSVVRGQHRRAAT